MLVHQLQEFFEILSVQFRQVTFVEGSSEFSEVRASLYFMDYMVGSFVIFFKAVRVVTDKIDPAAALALPGADRRYRYLKSS